MLLAHSVLLLAPLVGAKSDLDPAPIRRGEGTPALTHLVVNSGRATLVTDSGVHPVTQERTLEPFVGAGHLEVAPGSRVTLAWRGLCSMELEGPASLSWQPPRAPEGLMVHTTVLNRVDLEVRKMPLRWQLPGNWRGELQSGAYSVYSLGSGTNEFIHHAGRPVRLSWMGSSDVTAPVNLAGGTSFRMEASPVVEVRGSRDVQIPSWGVATWPWGRGGIEGVPDLLLEGAPSWGEHASWPWDSTVVDDSEAPVNSEEAATPSESDARNAHAPEPSGAQASPSEPKAWEAWNWPWGENSAGATPSNVVDPSTEQIREPQNGSKPTPDSEPAPRSEDRVGEPVPADPAEVPARSPAQSGPDGARLSVPQPGFGTSDENGTTEVVAEPRSGDTADPAPPAKKRQTFNPDQWRGLTESQLADQGVFRHQRGPDLKLTKNGDEGWLIEVDDAAPEPYWFFSRRLDVKVFPGATLEINSEGFLGHNSGLIRILSGRSDRAF